MERMVRAVLLAAIRFYRRHLSGRGPFARVRCAFERQESCSVFAERIICASPSSGVALLRIARRLSRCRHLSLYRLVGGRLGWGRDYDILLDAASPGEGARQLEESLARDGESEAVRAAVRRAAGCIAAVAARPLPAVPPGTLPLVRDAEAVRRAFTRRARLRGALAVLLVFLAGWAAILGACWLAVLAFLTALLPAAGVVASVRFVRRLDHLEVLAGIEGPRPSAPS